MEAINHDIIQLFDSDNMAQRSWRTFDKRNNPLKECFATPEIVEPCKLVLLLYTPGF